MLVWRSGAVPWNPMRVSPLQAANSSHVPVLDHLRGAAALAVCVFHFTSESLPCGDPIRGAGSFGWLGVQAFFVISGFVIPYSLHQRSYRLRDAGSFLIRRLKRLGPPYFTCILLVVCLDFLSTLTPGFRGQPYSLNGGQLIAHATYSNAVLGYNWLNPVFWTLEVELQFYLLVAVAFPLLNHGKPLVRVLSLLAVASCGLLGGGKTLLVPHWLPLFAVGMAASQLAVGRFTRLQFLMVFPVIACLGVSVLGPLQTLVGILTACAILWFRSESPPAVIRPLAWVGTISYSLYLLHLPLARRVANLAGRLPDSLAFQYPAVLIAFPVSIGCAWLLYKLVEAPSHRWARGPGRHSIVSGAEKRGHH